MARSAELQTLESEMSALSAELERLRQLQQAREKEAVSLDHDLRRTAEEIHRSNSRVSVARLELDRLKREEERTHEARARLVAADHGVNVGTAVQCVEQAEIALARHAEQPVGAVRHQAVDDQFTGCAHRCRR